jgi:histidinol-phosphate/aromatic aminotransferase/cobyric acid decarboxylase-like protein/choline kinase
MKAIILAAGFGNRMRPLTNTIHKTLIKIGNETIIERIINGLIANRIKDIVIVTGYLADTLKDYLLSRHSQINFTFVHNARFRQTNNIYSLALAMNSIEIDDDILIIESDLIYENNVIERIIKSPYANVALVDKFRSGMDGTVVTVVNSVITNIIPPHLQDANFDFSDKYKTLNIYKLSKEFCAKTFCKLLTYYNQTIDDNCYYELILGILIYMQREVIHAEIVQEDEKWSEVDDPNDLRVSDFIFNKENQLKILDETFGGFWSYDITDFCFIRNMYFPNTSILSELKNNLANLIHNYGSKQTILNQKLSYFLLCKEEHVNLLNGVSQVYPILRSAFPDDKVLIPKPTFGEYPRIFRNAVTYSDQIGIHLDEILTKADNCRVVVFVNPNNPTGSFLQSEAIYDFALRYPQVIVIVDESFIDFANGPSMFSLIEKTPLMNVLVLKSLSKCLGVPGLRIGFVYSHNRRFNQLIKESLPIWNMNSLAEFFLETILKHRRELQTSFDQTIRDREDFRSALSKLPFVQKVHPSAANFLLVELKDHLKLPLLASALLSEHSIYVRNISKKFSNGNYFLRLAVRLPEENNTLIEHLTRFFSV